MSIDHIPDDFGHWFAGFVDGEGCFYAGLDKKSRVSYYLAVTLRADDKEILGTIQHVLRCGKIYYYSSKEDRERGMNKKPQNRWVVTSGADIKKIIIPFFERFPLRAKKRRDFEIWKRISAQRGTTGMRNRIKTERQEIERLVAKLRAVRAYDYDPILAAEIEAQHTPTLQWEQQGLFQ